MGDWVNVECDNNDKIYYAIETFVRIGGFHSSHSNFETDTIIVLAEVNKTRGIVECCNIWPEIMNESEMRWELSEMMYQSIAAKSCFTTESGVAASIEYNSQIDAILSKRKDNF